MFDILRKDFSKILHVDKGGDIPSQWYYVIYMKCWYIYMTYRRYTTSVTCEYEIFHDTLIRRYDFFSDIWILIWYFMIQHDTPAADGGLFGTALAECNPQKHIPGKYILKVLYTWYD